MQDIKEEFSKNSEKKHNLKFGNETLNNSNKNSVERNSSRLD
jgi:hypothetical protein